MAEFNYCGLCLASDVRMCNINSSVWILETCSHLLRKPLVDRQRHICYLCLHMLLKFKQFQADCLMVHQLLSISNPQSTCVEIAEQLNNKIQKRRLQANLTLGPIVSVTNVYLTPHTRDSQSIKQEVDSDNDEKFTLTNDLQNTEDDNFIDEDNFKQEKAQIEEIILNNKSDATINMSKSRQLQGNKSDVKCINRNKNLIKKKSDNNKKKKCLNKNKNSVVLTDYFRVVKLTTEEAQKEILHRKEKSAKKNYPFLCNHCYRGYTSKTTFDNHMKIHSPENGSLECDVCHQRFRNKSKLRKHYCERHTKQYYCKQCSHSCISSAQATRHLNSHQGKEFSCKECGKVFQKSATLYFHMTAHHVSHVCDLCGSAFPSQRGIMIHKSLRHKDDENEGNGPKCDDCDVQFATELAYKRHLVLSKKHTVSNGCKICGETFSNNMALRLHVKEHHDPKSFSSPVSCTICDELLHTLDEYVTHMTSQHPNSDVTDRITKQKPSRLQSNNKNIMCEDCGKIFPRMSQLKRHRRTHTGEKPFSCVECGKRFSQTKILKTHLMTHESSRTYFKCTLCPKQLLSRSSLATHHKAKHLGLRPYKCEVCSKAFIDKRQMNLHVKYVHLKEPWPKRDWKKHAARRKAKRCVEDDELTNSSEVNTSNNSIGNV